MIKLSPREQEIMDLLKKGHKAVDIAVQLGIAFKTVQTYKERVMIKAGLKSIKGIQNHV